MALILMRSIVIYLAFIIWRNKMSIKDLINVAAERKPADLLLKNANIVNVFTGEIENNNVVIYQDTIAGIGKYDHAKKVLDLQGDYLSPAFINGHTHLESSMLHPISYARAVVPRGTLTVMTDLHEITNVCGLKGINFYINWIEKLPLDMFLMAPSCVPSTDLETSGANINVKKLKAILSYPRVKGLGEMMNFTGVIKNEESVIDKIRMGKNKIVDGHAPELSGHDLNAYIAAGIYS
ncbi:MAG: adenine deaminase, partial [Promethearchaeota archaeon]